MRYCCVHKEGTGDVEILVVDDHALIREALRGVLKEVKGDAIVLEASSCSQAMQVIAEHPSLDLILLDLNLPDRDGFSVLAELGERYPAISVMVLSAQQDRGSVVRALDLGALGFIPPVASRISAPSPCVMTSSPDFLAEIPLASPTFFSTAGKHPSKRLSAHSFSTPD